MAAGNQITAKEIEIQFQRYCLRYIPYRAWEVVLSQSNSLDKDLGDSNVGKFAGRRWRPILRGWRLGGGRRTGRFFVFRRKFRFSRQQNDDPKEDNLGAGTCRKRDDDHHDGEDRTG